MFLEILGGASALSGALGSLFGGGQETELPPELKQLFKTFEAKSKEGISTEEEKRLLEQLTGRLGSEFGALSSLTSQQLQRQGAGIGVQQAARERLSGQRFGALGQGISNIASLDERAKENALSQLSSLAGLVPQFTTETGGGFAGLFGAGLDLLSIANTQKQTKELLSGLPSSKTSVGYNPSQLAGIDNFMGR